MPHLTANGVLLPSPKGMDMEFLGRIDMMNGQEQGLEAPRLLESFELDMANL
jgi:hypothetical protein